MTTEGVYIIIILSVNWNFISFTAKYIIWKGRCFMTAFKKTLSGIMAFVLVIAFITAAPISVFAEESVGSGLSATEIELNKESNDEFEFIRVDSGSAIELVKYIGSEKEVSIPTRINSLSVVTVGENCFADNAVVEEIKLNSEIVTVLDGAFKNCTALKSVTKTESLTHLGASAFEGCTALESFEFPESVTAVPEKCFKGCTALAEVKEHKNLKHVAVDAFEGTVFENEQPDGPLSFGRVLYGVKGEVADIVIEKGISLIEDYVFIGCDYIKSVTFGPDVEEIGMYAFQNCTNLKTVSFDDAMGVISAGAFKGCTALESVDLSETTVAAIGYEAFSGCTSLKEIKTTETTSDIGDYAFAYTAVPSIELGKNISSIGANTFLKDKALTAINVVDNNKTYSSVDGVLYDKKGTALVTYPAAISGSFQLPDSVREIKVNAFKDSAVTEIIVSENSSLESIEAGAFEGSAIESIVIPVSVKKITASAFKDAEKLASVTFNEGLEYIGASAFEGCKSLTAIDLPDSLVEIANGAFRNTGLKSVNTGDGLAKIDTEAFAGNKALTDLYLGNNVEKLGNGAFKDCSALVAVTLPVSMKNFSANAFEGCKSLVKLSVAEGNTAYKAVSSAIYSADGKTLVVAGNSKTTSLIVVDGTEVIDADAFAFANNVSSISVPSSLTKVEDGALDNTVWFKNADGILYLGRVLYKVKGAIPSVIITDGTVAIADNAVNNSAVVSVVIPATVTCIGDGAFKGSSLDSVIIPASVKEIGTNAFADIKTLKTVKLAEGLETLGAAAFKNCAVLKSVIIPESVKVIPADAFAGCKKLAKVDLSTVETISKYAFSGCESLKTITLPATLTALDAMSFVGCTALENIDVEEGSAAYKSLDGVVLVANEETAENGELVFETIALYPAGRKGAYEVPETVKNIAEKAFYNCDALTEITFLPGFTNIGAEAFFDCDALVTINMPDSARDIGDHAFASCDELRGFIVNSNLTDYADNAFDGCYYFNYDAVTINVEESSSSIVIIIAAVFVLIGGVWYLSYRKKQKKIQQKIQEETAKREALEAAKAE